MFSNNLRKLRIKKGLTQEKIAKKIGVTAKSVGHWETGRRKPTFDKLIKLAKILEVSVDELIK